MKLSRQKILIILAFFAIYVIWGSTYLLNKIAVVEIPPLLLSSVRFTISGILIFIISKISAYKFKCVNLAIRFLAIGLFALLGASIVYTLLKFVIT